MTGCFWAPELHVIGGKLSVLFMPCFDGPRVNPDGTPNDRAGKPDMWTGSCHIMQLKQHSDGTDFDPREPENWTVPEPILDPDGEALNPIQRISLDMTVLCDSGRWYYAWQQVGSIWIASFDPDRPAKLASKPKQIVVPEFAWDNMIAEGPNAIVHDGTIFLIYSGSLVGIDYTTGLVTAPAGQGADLTDAAYGRSSIIRCRSPACTTGVGSSAPATACGRMTRTATSSTCSTTPNTSTAAMVAATPRCAACTGPRRACPSWICKRRRNSTPTMLV